MFTYKLKYIKSLLKNCVLNPTLESYRDSQKSIIAELQFNDLENLS